MLLDYKQIIGLPVETQSSQSLGKIAGFQFEAESQSVFQYSVKPLGLVHLFSQELLIHRNQVISISNEKMIVDDLVYKKLAASANPMPQNPLPAEVAASER